jgi:hypothetical protein
MPEVTLQHPEPGVSASPGPASGGGAAPVVLERLQEVASCCRALTLGRVECGVVHTVSATHAMASALDAMQYLDGGPSILSARYGTRVEARLLDGWDAGCWGLLQVAGRAVGVASAVSLPIAVGGAVTGTLTVYGGGESCDDQLQGVVHASPRLLSDAVRDAAPALDDRLSAALRPERARDQNAIDWALGLLAGRLGTDVAVAADLFRRAATRSGLADSDLAHHLTQWLGSDAHHA